MTPGRQGYTTLPLPSPSLTFINFHDSRLGRVVVFDGRGTLLRGAFKKKTVIIMEFSIFWFTPPPQLWKKTIIFLWS